MGPHHIHFLFFFFNDTATTEIYTLSLHDALPISAEGTSPFSPLPRTSARSVGITGSSASRPLSKSCRQSSETEAGDRKSTRLNSSHLVISYAVFCLKKKKLQSIMKTVIIS